MAEAPSSSQGGAELALAISQVSFRAGSARVLGGPVMHGCCGEAAFTVQLNVEGSTARCTRTHARTPAFRPPCAFMRVQPAQPRLS
jgi:hypothetical protein